MSPFLFEFSLFFFLVSLAKSFTNFVYLFKGPVCVSIDLSHCLFCLYISLIFAIISVVSFLLLTLVFVLFPAPWIVKFRLFIWDFFSFLDVGVYRLELILPRPVCFSVLCFHFHWPQVTFFSFFWFNWFVVQYPVLACCLVSMYLWIFQFSSRNWFLVSYHSMWQRCWIKFLFS